MEIEQKVILWLAITISIYLFVVQKTRNFQNRQLLKVVLRSAFGSIAFAPTLVFIGWFTLPAPASFVVALWYLFPDVLREHETKNNLAIAITMLLITFSIFATLISVAKRRTNQ